MRLSDIEWIAPGGTVLGLNSLASGVVLTDPPEGLILPPPLFTSAPIFNQPGQTLEQATYDVRTITVHLAVIGDSLDDFTGNCSFLASLFNPRAGDGEIRVTRDSGSSRLIKCRYTSGLEGIVPIGDDSNSDVWAEADVQFTAFDPYFFDAAANLISFRTAGSALWFPLDLAHGLDLSQSSIFADTTVSNAGDDLSWPLWTITGPAINPVITNTTTGAVLDLSANGGLNLETGDQLIIDTLAGTVTKIVGGVKSNAWPLLTPESDLFPFVGGDNVLHIVVEGASPATEVDVSYRLRWLTI